MPDLTWMLFAWALLASAAAVLVAISARCQKIALISNREQQLQDFAEASGGWLWQTDAELRFNWISASIENCTGVATASLYGKSRAEIGHFDDAPQAWQDHLQTLMAHQPFSDFEYRSDGPNGARWFRTSGIPIYDSSGRFQGYRGAGRDVTTLHRAESQAASMHQRLLATMNAFSGAFALYDREDRLLFCNRHYRELFEPAQIKVGDSFEHILTQLLEQGLIQDAIGHEQLWLSQRLQQFREPDPTAALDVRRGDDSWWQFQEERLLDGSACVTGLNISERRRAEQQLLESKQAAEEASRSKSEFLANMSHEIRTPINGVMGMTELLLDTELSERQRKYAETIARSSDLLLSVINDILDFSKIEAGKLELQNSPFDLRLLIEDTLELFAERAQRKELELVYALPDDAPTLLNGDPNRLRQVLTNLLGNAVKFTERGEVGLHVVTEHDDSLQSRLRFEVRDTGIGIRADARQHIFSSFAQADGSTTRRYGGTGLGLTISKQLIELMGGQIDVNSEAGVGSTFWFVLPFTLQSRAKRLHRNELGLLQGRTALVVDDNATNREILQQQLRNWQMRPLCAASGADAMHQLWLEIAAGNSPQVAIIDMHMPSMNGLTLARLLRADERTASLPLVMLSSISDEIQAEAEEDNLVDAYLTKPVRRDELLQSLAASLAGTALLLGDDGTGGDTPKRDEQTVVLAGRRVLVVDDSPINQSLLVDILQNWDVRADTAGDGHQAIERVAEHDYELILMDCLMPNMDGFQATSALREREQQSSARRRVPIIALTANAMSGDRERCLNAGMDDYLSKPFKQQVLRALLLRWLNNEPDRLQAENAAQD